MKKTTILSMAALLLGSSALFAQSAYTKPAGFVKHTLKAGQFNLIGLTLHEPVNVTGTFTAVAANNNGTTGDATDDYSVLTDTSVNFQTALTANKTYILEITSGDLAGTIQEVKTWNVGNNVNTIKAENDIVSGTGVKVGDKFQMREAATLASIFGTNNSLNLPASASSAASAVIWLQDLNDSVGFARYYYNTGGFGQSASWKRLNPQQGGGDIIVDASSVVIPYIDGILIQMPSGTGNLNIIFTGSVKSIATSVVVNRPFNYVCSGFAVNTTLKKSGIENSGIKNSASAAGSDILWIQQEDGSYNRYYYNTGGFGSNPVWKTIEKDNSGVIIERPLGELEDVNLNSAIIIQKNGENANALINPPYNVQ